MRFVGAFEAKTHFSQPLQEVAKGQTIAITRHGQPIAKLSPIGPLERRSVGEVIAELKALRRQARLEGLSVRELIEEGRNR